MLLQFYAISISWEGFSHKFIRALASLAASEMRVFSLLILCLHMFVEVYDPTCMDWLKRSQLHINFYIKGSIPFPNWLVTSEAYHSWYLSEMKLFALLLTEISNSWKRLVWLFGTCCTIQLLSFNRSLSAGVVCPLNTSKNEQSFCVFRQT